MTSIEKDPGGVWATLNIPARGHPSSFRDLVGEAEQPATPRFVAASSLLLAQISGCWHKNIRR